MNIYGLKKHRKESIYILENKELSEKSKKNVTKKISNLNSQIRDMQKYNNGIKKK